MNVRKRFREVRPSDLSQIEMLKVLDHADRKPVSALDGEEEFGQLVERVSRAVGDAERRFQHVDKLLLGSQPPGKVELPNRCALENSLTQYVEKTRVPGSVKSHQQERVGQTALPPFDVLLYDPELGLTSLQECGIANGIKRKEASIDEREAVEDPVGISQHVERREAFLLGGGGKSDCFPPRSNPLSRTAESVAVSLPRHDGRTPGLNRSPEKVPRANVNDENTHELGELFADALLGDTSRAQGRTR